MERAAETIIPLLPLIKVPELRRALDAENEPALALMPFGNSPRF
jgi:hypothetical protein